MSDLIDRKAAIDALNDEYHGMISDESMKIYQIINWLSELPSAQPLTAYAISDEDGNIKCSNCGSFECWGNFCMDCGAKMRGEQDE